jgi:uncharacterized protein YkwD
MKTKLLKLIVPFVLVFSLASCSNASDDNNASSARLVTAYEYSADEQDLAARINEYRVSIGLNSLEIVNHISFKSYEHNDYMIVNKVVNHAYFTERAENIKSVLGAVVVGENVAFNFSTPNSALHAWLNSPGHKANIEGEYTHFGVSITADPVTGKKYFTNIFMKK